MSEELKPCPFCGQQDAFVEQLDSDASVVICQGMVDEHSACLARGPVGVQQSELEDQPGKDAAIAAWNDRAQPAEAEGVDLQRLAAEFDAAPDDAEWEPPHPIFQMARDLDRATAALSAVTAERDRLESMLIRTATRHFALQIKDRADDKKLDECLSEGIAMLEAERDRLREENETLESQERYREQERLVAVEEADQLRAEVEALRALLIKSLPIVEAHAGASHMLEGFRPTRNKWDELVDGIRAVMSAKEA